MEDTTTTVVTEQPVMIFPNGEVTLTFTQTVTYTAHEVPVQALVEAVRKSAEARGVEIEEPDTNGGLWDMEDCAEYVRCLLDSQDSMVTQDVLDALREDGAEIEADDHELDQVDNA